jgi:hypothetical protein
MTYAEKTDLTVPYAETTDLDRAYRDSEAMRALAEVRLDQHDDAALSPQLEGPQLSFDKPCEATGKCFWGVPTDAQEACREPDDEDAPLPCDPGWWFVCTGLAYNGVYAAHPADAILLAARATSGA